MFILFCMINSRNFIWCDPCLITFLFHTWNSISADDYIGWYLCHFSTNFIRCTWKSFTIYCIPKASTKEFNCVIKFAWDWELIGAMTWFSVTRPFTFGQHPYCFHGLPAYTLISFLKEKKFLKRLGVMSGCGITGCKKFMVRYRIKWIFIF